MSFLFLFYFLNKYARVLDIGDGQRRKHARRICSKSRALGVSLSSRSEVSEVEEMVSARGRPYWEGGWRANACSAPLVSGLPALNHGISTHASPRAPGEAADLFVTSSLGDFWYSDDGASRKLVFFFSSTRKTSST